MNNDNDKLSLLLSDKSKKQLIFSKIYFQYFLASLVIITYIVLIFRSRWEYDLDILPYFTLEIIGETVAFVLPLILSISLAYKFAICRFLDWRYKRFDKENLYQEGKQYPFLYGAYLHEVKRLRRSLYTSYLIYSLFILLVGIHMFLVHINDLNDLLLNTINWII